MKRIAVMLLLLAMLLACVPTPDGDAVKQKDTNVLIDTVRSDEKEQSGAAATLPPVSAQFPERFTCDFTTSVQNVHIIADVPLEVLTDSVFPMLRVEPRTLSDAERLTIAQRVFGTDELYLWEDHISRKDLENEIRAYMQEPTPEEKEEWLRETDSTEEDWREMQERRKATLEELKKRYNELPEDDSRAPLKPWDGSVPASETNQKDHWEIVSDRTQEGQLYQQDHMTVYAGRLDRPMDYCVAWKHDSDVTWAGFFDGSHKFGAERIDPKDYDKPHEGAAVTPNDAVKLVQGLFDGVVDLVPADVYWANNAATDGEKVGVDKDTRWTYFIHFSQNCGGAYAPYCSLPTIDFSTEAGYTRLWRYETLMAAVDGEGNLISFDWFAPLKVTETIAESTPLLPFEEIQRIFEAQINRTFAYDEANGATLTVDGVKLGLFRIREKNDMDHGLLVPVWFFTGVLDYAEDVAANRLAEGHSPDYAKHNYKDEQNPLLIINAIDGSIIDPVNGY